MIIRIRVVNLKFYRGSVSNVNNINELGRDGWMVEFIYVYFVVLVFRVLIVFR